MPPEAVCTAFANSAVATLGSNTVCNFQRQTLREEEGRERKIATNVTVLSEWLILWDLRSLGD